MKLADKSSSPRQEEHVARSDFPLFVPCLRGFVFQGYF